MARFLYTRILRVIGRSTDAFTQKKAGAPARARKGTPIKIRPHFFSCLAQSLFGLRALMPPIRQ